MRPALCLLLALALGRPAPAARPWPRPEPLAAPAPEPITAEDVAAEAAGLPPLSALRLLPPEWLAVACHESALAHVRWLEGQVGLGEYERLTLTPQLLEARRLLACWDTLRTAHYWLRHRDPPNARESLRDLRYLLGESHFRCGLMPPPLPIGYIPRGD